jgi:anti-anti-sigma factor
VRRRKNNSATHAESSLNKLNFPDLGVSWISEESVNQNINIVSFRGEINEKNSFALNQKFYIIQKMNRENTVILDLSELFSINSVGLAILHSLIFRIQEEKVTVIIGGLHPFIKRIFSLIEGFPAMKVFDSREEAKKSLLWQYHL